MQATGTPAEGRRNDHRGSEAGRGAAMRAPRRRTGAIRIRRGYTLTELMIVLAVLVAVTAFAAPALRGPLDKSRLRGAARDVRAALGKARAIAIREGADTEFWYERDGRRWKVLCPRRWRRPPTDAAGGESSLRDPAAAAEAMAGPSSFATLQPLPPVVLAGELPEGVRFFDPDPALDAATQGMPSGLRGSARETDDAALLAPNAPGLMTTQEFGIDWQPGVTFRAHGRGEDAEFLLRGQRDFAIRVTVRGLTASAAFGAPFRLDPLLLESLDANTGRGEEPGP